MSETDWKPIRADREGRDSEEACTIGGVSLRVWRVSGFGDVMWKWSAVLPHPKDPYTQVSCAPYSAARREREEAKAEAALAAHRILLWVGGAGRQR